MKSCSRKPLPNGRGTDKLQYRERERVAGGFRCEKARGFTLLEVVIALAIVALELGILLEVQASSLGNASRARDTTVATLLARSKMIDIERALFDEGFTLGDQEERGDFSEEGHSSIKWQYRISEMELDLGSIGGLCGMMGGDDNPECETMLSALGAPLQGLTEELGRSMRLVELEVSWPVGKYSESLKVRTLVTRDDFGLAPGQAGLPGAPGGPNPSGTPNPQGVPNPGVNPANNLPGFLPGQGLGPDLRGGRP